MSAQPPASTTGRAGAIETRTFDPWDPAVNDPATRGGLYVALLGDDGVRYCAAHLETVKVDPGQPVAPGDQLGVMGQTGNARNAACHTHFGISWPCPEAAALVTPASRHRPPDTARPSRNDGIGEAERVDTYTVGHG